METVKTVRFYVWKISFMDTGEVLISSRPYTTFNRAKASLKQMAEHYANIHESKRYYLDIIATTDHRPSNAELVNIVHNTPINDIIITIMKR